MNYIKSLQQKASELEKLEKQRAKVRGDVEWFLASSPASSVVPREAAHRSECSQSNKQTKGKYEKKVMPHRRR